APTGNSETLCIPSTDEYSVARGGAEGVAPGHDCDRRVSGLADYRRLAAGPSAERTADRAESGLSDPATHVPLLVPYRGIQAIRQILGHKRLPVYVGDIEGKAPYRPD